MTTAEPSPTAATREPEAAGSPSSASERAEFWQGTFKVWTVAFAVGLALAGATLVLQVADGAVVARGLGLLVAIGLAYALVAVPAVRRGDARLAYGYLAIVCILTTLSVLNAPLSVVLLFIVYAQMWFFGSSRRIAALFTLILTIGVFGTFAWLDDFSAAATRDAIVQGAFAALFSTLLGLWVTYIAEQSEVRAELIAQLESTQVELARASHASGVTAERERMAREIHDTLAQGLASIVMLSQTAQAELERGEPTEALASVQLVESTARENLAEARALVAAFGPVDLAGSSLVEALDRLIARFAAETGVRVELNHDGDVDGLARDHEVVVLRTAQEALTNVRRHSGASIVRLRLSVADAVTFEVADDGRGIPARQAEGFGLRGMRDRVEATGGAIELESPTEGGTIVRARLPRTEEGP